MTFGEKIVKRRNELFLSQKELASRLGISPTRLNYWEKDKREPDVGMIKELSKALHIPADILIGNEEYADGLPYKDDEIKLVLAYRKADPTYKEVALEILLSHPQEQKNQLA